MKNISREQAWNQLQQQALVEGALPPAAAQAQPWYIRVLQGVCAWLAAIFLLAFIVLFFAGSLGIGGSILIGLLCCAAAYAILRADNNSEFLVQFGIAISLCGQSLVIHGILEAFNNSIFSFYAYSSPRDIPAFLLIAAFEVALVALMPNAMHRLLSAFAASVALAMGVEVAELPGISSAIAAAAFCLVWLEPQRWAVKGDFWRPIGYGLALAWLYLEKYAYINALRYLLPDDFNLLTYYPSVIIGFVLLALVYLWAGVRLIRHEHIALASPAGGAALLTIALLIAFSYFASGIAAASLILLLGFACGNRILQGLGVIALLGFLAHYYYQLDLSLLMKSATLAASGALLLLVHWALQRYFPASQETSNA